MNQDLSKLAPVAATPPDTATITPYDRAHFLTYARLIDDLAHGVSWQHSAIAILGLDLLRHVAAARTCWEAHVARAHWVINEGVEALTPVRGKSRLH